MKTFRKIAVLMLAFIIAIPTVGCGKKKLSEKEYLELAQTQAERNKKKIALQVMGPSGAINVSVYDLVYFLAYNEKDALEQKDSQDAYNTIMYGEGYDFWNIAASDGTIMKDGYKERAYATAVYTLLFYNEAVQAGMELSEAEKVRVNSVTRDFLAEFSPEQRAKCGMTEECIRDNYTKLFLVQDYVDTMTADYEIDEEEVRASVEKEKYRVYETDYLYVSKYDYDENYHRVEYTPEESEARKNAVMDSLERVQNGGDMVSIQKEYSEIMGYGTRDFYSDDISMEAEYIEAGMKLQLNECTLCETETSYYIISMIDNTKYLGYEEAVTEAMDSAKAVGVADLFKQKQDSYTFTKTEEWETITMGDFSIVK